MAPARTTLITGASGFIGGWLTEAMWLSGDREPRAGIRRWSSAARIARFPVDIVPCDIMDPAQASRATTGATAVVHCAYTDEAKVIVEGTGNMLAAALDAGVERFVYLSTAEIYGGAEGVVDEQCPPRPSDREYPDAKIEAEKLCWEFAARGLPVTVLRPSIVYGPFGGSWTVKLAARLQSENWGTFEAFGNGICNLVYIGDLIRAVELALERDEAAGEAFNVNGPERVTWNEYFEAFNHALGLPPLPAIPTGRARTEVALKDVARKMSGFLLDRYGDALMKLYLRGGIANRLMKRMKRSLVASPSGFELRNLYTRQAYYSCEKARRLLGYAPSVDLATGLRLTASWLDHHGYLRRPPPTSPLAAAADSARPADPRSGRDDSVRS